MENNSRRPLNELGQEELRAFFISHLHRIYCAKNQLVDKLPQLSSRSYYLDLQQAIDETVDGVKLQIKRMQEIYTRLDALYMPESCVGLVGILDEAFQSIGTPGESAELRDLSILFYMHNIESVEAASFKIMLRVAGHLPDPAVVQLLLECYDETREDKALFQVITENYL